MKCENAILLVEKLVDGEASADEKALAEQHVAACADCRSHYAFVKALASASEKIELPPAPPQAYWDHLPSRIVARLHEDERPGFWQQLFTPSVLRWGALAATLTVVVAVGMNVLREGDLAVETPAQEKILQTNKADIAEELEAPDEDVEAVEAFERAPASPPEASPPVASFSPPAPARDPQLRRGRELEDARSNESDSETLRQTLAVPSRARAKSDVADAVESNLRVEPREASETSDVETSDAEASDVESPAQLMAPVTAEPMRSLALGESRVDPAELEYQELSGGARPGLAGLAGLAGRRGSAVTVEDCDRWRAYLERYPEGSRASDARYELARCTLARYEAEPSEAGHEVAIRDADAFLAVESEGTRAEEIRERAAPLRRP